jgi:hypothetical protein
MNKSVFYLFYIIVLASIVSAGYNLSLEGQLYNSSGGILTGTYDINITLYNSSNTAVSSASLVDVALDSNGRFFESISPNYNFRDNVSITFKVEGYPVTAKSNIGYVPYAVNAQFLEGKASSSFLQWGLGGNGAANFYLTNTTALGAIKLGLTGNAMNGSLVIGDKAGESV